MFLQSTITEFTGAQYLAIDIANHFGRDSKGNELDKTTWAYRLDWFESNKHQLEAIANKSENVASYSASVMAYRAMERGEPIGRPISLDATASGLQLLSVLTGDRKGATICNVLNAYIDKQVGDIKAMADDVVSRMDSYTAVHEEMVDQLAAALADVTRVTRKDAKRAVMTSLYGSEAVPKEVFGEGLALQVFYQVMQTVAPAAWELNESFLSMWDPEATEYEWILPDNFHVRTKVMTTVTNVVQWLGAPVEVTHQVNAPKEKGRSLGANCIHSVDGFVVREMVRRCSYSKKRVNEVLLALDRAREEWEVDDEDARMVQILMQRYRESGFLSARILDHITVDNAMLVDKQAVRDLIDELPSKPFKVLTIHDCFQCLPHYGNDLRKQYNLILAHIGASDTLSFLLSQILKTEFKVPQLDPQMWYEILESEYALS